MLRSLYNFGKVFTTQNVHVKCSKIVPLLIQNSSYKRAIHSSITLLQNNFSSASIDSVPTVYISGVYTGFGKKSYSAVYWDKNDSLNTLKRNTSTNASSHYARIKSLILALHQSIFDRKLDKIIIKTDSESIVKSINDYLPFWRKNGYIRIDGKPVKHKKEYQIVDKLLAMIDAQVQLLPLATYDQVLKKFIGDSKHVKIASKPLFGIKATYDPNSKYSNLLFVCGTMINEKSGYGIHFKGNKKLDVKSTFKNELPFTLARTFMFGIIHALNVIKSEGLKDAVIVTDDVIFLKYFYREWKKSDGSSAKNVSLYEIIRNLVDEMNVSFHYLTDANDPDFKKAVLLARKGMKMATTEKK